MIAQESKEESKLFIEKFLMNHSLNQMEKLVLSIQ